jgi:outer membrane protein OmpA-like peptidoglycan-associated protein
VSMSLRISMFVILSVIVSGCTSGSLVVLVPNPDGKTGEITVSNPAGSVNIAAPNQASIIKTNTESPKSPEILDRETIHTLFADALSMQPQPPVHFILYFEKDLMLDAESARLLPGIMAAITERKSRDISVVGHTDTVGSSEYNLTLSKKRAHAVTELLIREGVDPGIIATTSHGKENPLIKTKDNVYEPRNRRVEVIVR